MPDYINVTSDESTDQEPIELPTEEDGTMLLSTVGAQFPDCCGLKFRHPDTGGLRGVRLADGFLHPPEDGWGSHLYIAVFPKKSAESTLDLSKPKRKFEDAMEAASKRVSRGKCVDLVVLGLAWKTTEDSLKEYFTEFGEVEMAQLKKDKKTGQPKGYGFVRFHEYQAQVKCLAMPQHLVDKCWCDVKIPNSQIKNVETSKASVDTKIYVGRCSKDIEAEDLYSYFEKYGEVVDVFVPKPHRGFAFVTFSDPEVARQLFGEEYVVKGCSVYVSSAAPKNYDKKDQNKQQSSGNSGYGNSGYGNGSSGNYGSSSGSSNYGNSSGNQGLGYGGSSSSSRWGGYSTDYNSRSSQSQYSYPPPPPPPAQSVQNSLNSLANPLAGLGAQNFGGLNPTMVAAAAAALAQGGLGSLLSMASQAAATTTTTTPSVNTSHLNSQLSSQLTAQLNALPQLQRSSQSLPASDSDIRNLNN